MTSDEAAPAPRDPLRGLAKASIILGIVSLIRFAPELVLVFQHHPDWSYFVVLAMDVLIASLWLKCGLSLRRYSEGAIAFASIAGAAIFAHGGTSAFFFGMEILGHVGQLLKEPAILAFFGSRFLIYGIELCFWPFALMKLTRFAAEKGRRPPVMIVSAWAFVIAAILQAILLAAMIRRS